MVKKKFLIKKVYGKAWSLSCNVQHPLNYSRKIAFNLAMVYDAYHKGIQEEIATMVGNAYSVISLGVIEREMTMNKVILILQLK